MHYGEIYTRAIGGGSGSPKWGYARTFAPVLLAFALPALIFIGAARADNGESGDTLGTYSASSPGCQQLRNATGVTNGAVTFACNASRDRLNGREACDVFSLSGTLVRGSALGFCADSISTLQLADPETAPLEVAKTVSATSYGVNVGMILDPPNYTTTPPIFARNTVDTVCTTFGPPGGATGPAAQGVRVCRQVSPCSGTGCTNPAPRNCPAAAAERDLYLRTFQDNSLCQIVRQQLAATITGRQTTDLPLSHVLFLTAKLPPPNSPPPPPPSVGQPRSQALLVCLGYRWDCGKPEDADNGSGSQTDYQIGYDVIQSPGCTTVRTVTGGLKQLCYP